ncbi:MAG TPA: ABC transporter substrate-binding protein [Longimicrobium sp.]|nr:ABC transporter substrate-binding protein [Longimicrobium sp.]
MNARGWKGAAARRAGVLALLALAAACADRRQEEGTRGKGTDDGGPRRGGTAVVAEIADVQQPFPLFFTGGLDSDMMDVMYMGLTRGAWRDGRLVALLSDRSPMAMAWHWEYLGPDSTSIRYRMRSALRWSDGQPITAHDVVFTYGLYADTALASPRLSNMAQIDSVAAENDSTVVFHFKRRYPEMIFDSGLAIIPRHVYRGVAPAALSTHSSISRPQTLVVSGAFMIGDHQPGAQITMVPNPHFSVRPLLDRLVIRVIPEPTTRLVELRNGTVHFARGVTFDQIAALRQQAPGVGFEVESARFWEYLGYNLRRPMFADVNVRRALGLAIDVPAIIRQLRMEEWVTQAAGPYGPIQEDFFDPQRMRPLPYDTAQARRLLDAAGWHDTDGDGIREKNGRPFRFTLLTNTANQRRTDVSQILQRMWRAVGADVQLQAQEFGTVQERQFGPDHDFDVVLGSWGVELSGVLSPLFSPDAHLNFVGFDDPAAARLMRQAEAQPTLATAAPLWRATAERIVQMQPYTWLYWYGPVTARDPRLRGVRVDAYGAYQNVWEWWLAGGGSAGAADDTAKRDTGR